MGKRSKDRVTVATHHDLWKELKEFFFFFFFFFFFRCYRLDLFRFRIRIEKNKTLRQW